MSGVPVCTWVTVALMSHALAYRGSNSSRWWTYAAKAIAAAVMSPDGRVVTQTPAFHDLGGAAMVDGGSLQRAARAGLPKS